ncbi:MAG: 50S ribosomal protein L5 [Acidobacteria bacterium]|nr:50S ribosomal protein L5 [Acidobacteriota bacterium]
MATAARLKARYDQEVVPLMMDRFGYKNRMAVPRLNMIVLNMGVGDALQNIKLLDNAAEQMTLVAGQKAAVTRAKKSIANFKIREGNPLGCRVTLRGGRMYEFFDRLCSIALPRVRDFRGLPSKSFDGRGNYTLGVKDQMIFPEVNYQKVDRVRGMNISIITTARTDEEAKNLLTLLGLPFRKD